MIHSPSNLPPQSQADLNTPTNQPRPQATEERDHYLLDPYKKREGFKKLKLKLNWGLCFQCKITV